MMKAEFLRRTLLVTAIAAMFVSSPLASPPARAEATLLGLTVSDIAVSEGKGGPHPAAFTVRLARPRDKTVRVAYSTVDGTAKAGTDYLATSGTLIFAPGEQSKAVFVTILGDLLDDDDDRDGPLDPHRSTTPGDSSFDDDDVETFSLRLGRAINADVSDNTGVATIVDDELSPNVTGTSMSLVEGDQGDQVVQLTVALTHKADVPLTYEYRTVGVTATAGVDYVPVSGTLTFEPFETVKTLEVTILSDDVPEGTAPCTGCSLPNELLRVALRHPGAATDSGVLRVFVHDDDAPLKVGLPVLPSASIADVQADEVDTGWLPMTTTVRLASPALHPVSIAYTTVDGARTVGDGQTTGTAGDDYEPVQGTLTFAPGETFKQVTVLVPGDTTDGMFPDIVSGPHIEGFSIELSDAVGAWLSKPTADMFVIDNDWPASVSPVGSTVREGDTGEQVVEVAVTLSSAQRETWTVAYEVEDDRADNLAGVAPATAGEDFAAANGTLVFQPGETLKTVSVRIVGDSRTEPDERFVFRLSTGRRAFFTILEN